MNSAKEIIIGTSFNSFHSVPLRYLVQGMQMHGMFLFAR